MNNDELILNLKDKKFFKKATGTGGILGLIDPSYKRYLASSNQSVHEQEILSYYKPDEEGTDQGFGEYAVFACVLNEQGRVELETIKSTLESEGLLHAIGNIRYESQSADGAAMIDVPPDDKDDEDEGRIRKHSTDNVYVYVLTADNKKRSLNNLKTVVIAKNPEYGRLVFPVLV